MTAQNIDTFDENGNILHHIGPSTEWWKTYDAQGRELTYRRSDGQVARTTRHPDGSHTTIWDPPIPEPDAFDA